MSNIKREITVFLGAVSVKVRKTPYNTIAFVLSKDGGQFDDSRSMEVDLKPENIDDLIAVLTEAKGL